MDFLTANGVSRARFARAFGKIGLLWKTSLSPWPTWCPFPWTQSQRTTVKTYIHWLWTGLSGPNFRRLSWTELRLPFRRLGKFRRSEEERNKSTGKKEKGKYYLSIPTSPFPELCCLPAWPISGVARTESTRPESGKKVLKVNHFSRQIPSFPRFRFNFSKILEDKGRPMWCWNKYSN